VQTKIVFDFNRLEMRFEPVEVLGSKLAEDETEREMKKKKNHRFNSREQKSGGGKK